MSRDGTRITTEVDFEKDGKQTGFLRVPISTHESAYGAVPVPVISIRNGGGPRVLLVAGNHGDEYEGQLALVKLARMLQPNHIDGQVTILPAANLPAVKAGRRTSPLDEGNLNRTFPGDPTGSPTEMIAHFIESVLLPTCDYVVDLHSGGQSLAYTPCTLVRVSDDEERRRRMFDALRAFGAPIGYITAGREGGAERTLAAAADRCGTLAISAELGGGATVSSAGLSLAEAGVKRLLRHFGVLVSNLAEDSISGPCRLMEVRGPDYFVFTPDDGAFEPLAELGDTVEEGQPAALIHFPETPWREPIVTNFRRSGLVICKRVPARTARGDCLYHLATDCEN